jgi:hypothetical protein
MNCLKCGAVLQENRGTFTCLRGDMELSRNMADRLYACFVAKTEEPKRSVEIRGWRELVLSRMWNRYDRRDSGNSILSAMSA